MIPLVEGFHVILARVRWFQESIEHAMPALWNRFRADVHDE
jgi:hypothetical protein